MLATVILLAVVAELLSMTITDPKIYTKLWTSQLKRFRSLPKNEVKTIDGWAGLFEDLCTPPTK